MRTLTIGGLALALVAGGTRAASAQAAPAGVRADLVAQLDEAASKLVQLAQAIPQEKYTWRPGPGVRSVSEVLMHVAGGNFYFPTFLGVKAPEGTSEAGDSKVTDKAQVIAQLKRSFDHVRSTLSAWKDADLDKPVTMFGRQTTSRNVFLTAVTHSHEHLGQLIAYARMNGIVPPWSVTQGQ